MTTEIQWLEKLGRICPNMNAFLFSEFIRITEGLRPCPLGDSSCDRRVGSSAKVWHAVSHANDDHGWSFDEIARWLEQNYDLEVIS